MFCVGLDSYENIFKNVSPNAFIVAQTPYSDVLLKKAGLILPSTSFLEKEATFLNLEGRAQKTAIALKGPSLARADFQILKTIFASNFKKLNSSGDEMFSKIEENKKAFTNVLAANSSFIPKKIFKSSFKSFLSNFFITNAITKNSVVMAKCFLIFKQNYKNFIL